MNRTTSPLAAAGAALALALVPAAAAAQGTGAGSRPVSIDLRGGLNVPTFDIADAAEAGPSFGAGIGIPLGSRVSLRANADFGFHPGATADDGTELPDVNVYHYIGGLGVVLHRSSDGRLEIAANAGAGAMTFDVDGGPSETYAAINVGGTLAYRVAPAVSLLLSPQGDIAFTDEDVLGTDNAWVWPFTAGVRITP